MVVIAFVLAQGKLSMGGNSPQHTDPNVPTDAPPLLLMDANSRALARIGEAANHLYCVGASCLDTNTSGWPGWTFVFANTNRGQWSAKVYFWGEAFVQNRRREKSSKKPRWVLRTLPAPDARTPQI